MKYITMFLILIFASTAFALPKPVGYVNDFANILPDKGVIEELLNNYEKNTTIEIAVVTLDALPENQNIYTYSVELFEEWGIGKKGEDNGILVLIVKNGTAGNRMKIELGYGMQGYITGAEAGRILDAALPSYEKGDYQDAVFVILERLGEQLENYEPGTRYDERDLGVFLDVFTMFLPFIFIIAFSIIAHSASQKCPDCGSRKIDCKSDMCVCKKCGKKFKRKKRATPFVFVGGFGGSGGGFGGFGGGGSGGGGAGR
jgi:uncharacterized protein